MKTYKALLALAATLSVSGVNVYTFSELARDNAKTNITREDLNGFESVDHKLNVVKDSFFENLPQEIAEQ